MVVMKIPGAPSIMIDASDTVDAFTTQMTASVQYVGEAAQAFDAAALAVLSTKSIDLANTVSALPFIG